MFNQITAAHVYAADQLFATLDPTLRRLEIADVGPIVLADTVGFIRHLPHKLVEAFRATLEETRQADLLVHVVDASASERTENIEQVESVLREIKADEIPVLEVFNKIDLMGDRPAQVERDEKGKPVRVWLSAKDSKGLDLLSSCLSELLSDDILQERITLKPHWGWLRSQLYKQQAVLNEDCSEAGESILEIRIPKKDLRQLLKKAEIKEEEIRLDDKLHNPGYNTLRLN